jgi:FAD binding domain-containing protein
MSSLKTSQKLAQSATAAARDLRATMQGRVVLPGEAAYASTRAVWNCAVDHQPALFALCKTAGDVQRAIRAARVHRLPLSVRGGGHDWAGRALCHEGLVIDLSEMRHVEVDPRARVATVAGGAQAADLIAAASPHGLAGVTGTAGTIGMAGMTLGGGYGPLTPQYGLALDNLLGADVVLADGRIVTADAANNTDLWWALRGGGGNFGVVVSMRIRLHPIRGLLAGLILFPWSEAESVLQGYANAVASAPDALSVIVGVLSGPDGDPMLVLAPTWSGEPAKGEDILTALQCLGSPILVTIGPKVPDDVFGVFGSHGTNGCHYAVRTRWLSKLTPDAISALVSAGTNRTSPFTAIVLHHFHGTPSRVPLGATAFGLRREHFLVVAIAAWEPGPEDNGAIHRQWARTLSRTLASSSLPGGYPSLLGPNDHDQIALAYGTNIARLKALKRRFDPDGIFTSAIPLPEDSQELPPRSYRAGNNVANTGSLI